MRIYFLCLNKLNLADYTVSLFLSQGLKHNLFQQKAFAEKELDLLREEEVLLLSEKNLKVELVEEKTEGTKIFL